MWIYRALITTKPSLVNLCVAFAALLIFMVLAVGRSEAAGAVNVKLNSVNNGLQINTQKIPLAELMQKITRTTGISLHYRMPKDLVINSHCDKSTFAEAMTCVFGQELGLAVSYSPEGKPKEAWLFGIVGDGNVATTDTLPVQVPQITETEPDIDTDSDRQELAGLIAKARSREPGQRMEALSNLAAAGGKNDSHVRKVLTDALADKNPAIRASAIASLARREGEAANIELQQILNDSDVSVRLAAVDSAGNNSEFLQQALKDSNPMVRNVAEGKLKTLNRNVERGL